MNIAVLLTCFNRRKKTERCLQSLKIALDVYNNISEEKIRVEIFLTDDGCSDGTADGARAIFPDSNVLHILQGDGNLYWAGGMRYCWREAMKNHSKWDFYLLLNDDTELKENMFKELLAAQQYATIEFGKNGIVSGITCASNDPNQLTYGGDVITNRLLATRRRLSPTGTPQFCDLTNANILLVPVSIVNCVGIFYDGYTHGLADTDYSYMVRRAGFPIVLTANYCGACDNDHDNTKERANKIVSMSLTERKRFFNNPINSNRDYLRLIRRTAPIRFPLVWMGRLLNLYFPKLYYRIGGIR